MTPKQIHHVQHTFELLIPIADTAVALFYNRMLELDSSGLWRQARSLPDNERI